MEVKVNKDLEEADYIFDSSENANGSDDAYLAYEDTLEDYYKVDTIGEFVLIGSSQRWNGICELVPQIAGDWEEFNEGKAVGNDIRVEIFTKGDSNVVIKIIVAVTHHDGVNSYILFPIDEAPLQHLLFIAKDLADEEEEEVISLEFLDLPVKFTTLDKEELIIIIKELNKG